jgi:hypothetical protein
MSFSISKTLPLRRLLSRIGHSTYRFNTILVGLSCVAAGGGDGGAIAVTWTKPESAGTAKNAASQARSFACAGALVLAADVLDAFLREIAEETWLRFAPHTVGIATKAQTRTKDQGGAYSVAERAEALAVDLGIEDLPAIALIELFSKWRNVVAHSLDRSPNLAPRFLSELKQQGKQISDLHSHLCVDLAISNFQNRAVPVPKEVTSLIANAVRFARAIDKAAILRVASEPGGVEAAADWGLSRFFTEHGRTSRSLIADAWQGNQDRRSNAIKKWLASVGVSESSKPISAILRSSYVPDLAALSREQFASRYGGGTSSD